MDLFRAPNLKVYVRNSVHKL